MPDDDEPQEDAPEEQPEEDHIETYEESLEKGLDYESLAQARQEVEHLDKYLNELPRDLQIPEYQKELKQEVGDMKEYNVIYPVGGNLFIHVFRRTGNPNQYRAIEPRFTDEEQELYEEVLDKLINVAYKEPVPQDVSEMSSVFVKLLNDVVTTESQQSSLFGGSAKIEVTEDQFEKIRYFLLRNRVGYGKLEPIFLDPHLEDIHCTGVGRIEAVHGILGMVFTDVEFKDDMELNEYIKEVSERVERPASDTNSVVDAIMPDGSRVNFIYGRDISLEGSSFTIRKFSSTPLSITQIMHWGTFSTELGAYLWLALEHGMNVFVCGETASGKTTTLNAIATFIKPDDKVYTVENTPEVTMPHEVWQHLLTRESGTEADVTYFDLLEASLRSRPNYIIVGEIRGEEGSIAFQAMQTGHPVMSTFHAGDVQTMIQRLNGDPINVPLTFMTNLNISLIQQAVYRGTDFVRRVLSATELERYYAPAEEVVTREVFTWDTVNDEHNFRGRFNSYILEEKIAKIRGYDDPKKVYEDMDYRKKILDKMIEQKIFDYFEVWQLIRDFYYEGEEALPFEV